TLTSTPTLHHLPHPPLFFFKDPPTTHIYTLSLHDALPISHRRRGQFPSRRRAAAPAIAPHGSRRAPESGTASPNPPKDRCHPDRSEEHTSELQSLAYLVCRLLLEKKKKKKNKNILIMHSIN